MSALLRTASPSRTDVAPGTYALVVGADTRLSISVVHTRGAAATGHGRTEHEVRVDGEPLVAPNTRMHVVAPLPAYTHPSQEPDDNSLAARAVRMARVRMHGTTDAIYVWALTYVFFTLWPDQEYFVLEGGADVDALLLSGLAMRHPAEQTLLFSRMAFWQGAGPLPLGTWVPLGGTADFPLLPTLFVPSAQGLRAAAQHPLRRPKVGACAEKTAELPVYRRYIPELQQTLTLRCARSQSDTDVDLLHRWHATERVNTGWRQDMPRDAHKKYLEDQEASGESLALIGEWDGEPFGYIEIYYAKETPLRLYFDAGDYDRGFHALVGEERFRGPHRVRSWMGSVVHLLFLLDPRTQRVVSEPRASNTKMVEYECLCGGHVEKVRA